MDPVRKPVRFHGSALEDLRTFPEPARQDAGFQVDRAQKGLDPDDWKPMKTVGKGVREIRIRDQDGAFRVVYIASLADAVHVLHCFQKKSRATEKRDIELASVRYRRLIQEQSNES